MAQLVAHHTGSVGVTGSNPVSSTEKTAGCLRTAVFVFPDRRRHHDALAVTQRELQPVGVQEHALRARAGAVRAVADDGVAFVGGVHADLVASSSNELGLDERVRPAVFHAAESCVGVVAVGAYDHGFRCSRDRGLYVARARPASLHDRAVDADHVLLAEGSLQVAQLRVIQRDQQRPERLLIDAVRKLSVGVHVTDALDNAAPRPGPRMHRHPRRLILLPVPSAPPTAPQTRGSYFSTPSSLPDRTHPAT